MRGERNVLWGLVREFRNAFPGLASNGQQFLSRHQLPYSRRDMKRLATSLLHWVYSLGVPYSCASRVGSCSRLQILGPGLIPSDIDEIQSKYITPTTVSEGLLTGELCSGVLLCDIVSELEGKKVLLLCMLMCHSFSCAGAGTFSESQDSCNQAGKRRESP